MVDKNPNTAAESLELRDLARNASRPAPNDLSRIPLLKPRDNQAAIAAGLDFLFAGRRHHDWVDFSSLQDPSDTWVTAFVLAQMAEIPGAWIGNVREQQVRQSLKWLLSVQGSDGGWGLSLRAESDAESTAWAIRALRGYDQRVPESAVRFIERCRRSDGGIGPYAPESPSGRAWTVGSPDVTALAISVLGSSGGAPIDAPDPAAADFLRSCWLQTNRPLPAFRVQSRFYACALLLALDAPEGSWPVLEKLCELMSWNKADNAFDQAMLLRCLTGLQIQKSASVASGLRRMQRPDGGWPASALITVAPGRTSGTETGNTDDKRIVTTVAAIAALAQCAGASSPARIGGV
jgi:hypothetical protein